MRAPFPALTRPAPRFPPRQRCATKQIGTSLPKYRRPRHTTTDPRDARPAVAGYDVPDNEHATLNATNRGVIRRSHARSRPLTGQMPSHRRHVRAFAGSWDDLREPVEVVRRGNSRLRWQIWCSGFSALCFCPGWPSLLRCMSLAGRNRTRAKLTDAVRLLPDVIRLFGGLREIRLFPEASVSWLFLLVGYLIRFCCVDGSHVGGEGGSMKRARRPGPPARMPSGFDGFRFPPEVILLAVRWYLRYGLSYRDLEEPRRAWHRGRPRHRLSVGTAVHDTADRRGPAVSAPGRGSVVRRQPMSRSLGSGPTSTGRWTSMGR